MLRLEFNFFEVFNWLDIFIEILNARCVWLSFYNNSAETLHIKCAMLASKGKIISFVPVYILPGGFSRLQIRKMAPGWALHLSSSHWYWFLKCADPSVMFLSIIIQNSYAALHTWGHLYLLHTLVYTQILNWIHLFYSS